MPSSSIARLILVGSFCAASVALVLPAGANEVVALHPLKGLGVDAETVSNLESIVRHELNRLPGMRLVDAERTRLLVREGVECDGLDPCLASLAAELGAAVAVYGVVGGLGESYTITLKAVEAQGGEVRSRVQLRVGGAREVLIDGIRTGVFKLLRPDLFVGSLQLDLPEEGAEVYLDGRLVGVTPLAELVTGLPPGQLALKIVKTGFSDFDRFIEIRFQRTSVVTIDLERSAVAGVIYEETPLPDGDDLGDALPLASLVESDVSEEDSPTDADSLLGDAVLASEAKTETATGSGTGRAIGGRGMRIAAYALMGSGGITLAAGGVQGLFALSQEKDLADRFAEQGGPLPGDLEAWNRANSTADRANLLYVAGGVVTAAGVAVLVMDILRTQPDAASTPALAQSGLSIVPGTPAGALGLTLFASW